MPTIFGRAPLTLCALSDEVQGLAVCYYAGGIIGIYGFSGVSQEFNAFVNSTNQRLITEEKYWFYFPINAGEFIEKAWIWQVVPHYSIRYYPGPVLIVSSSHPHPTIPTLHG